MEKRCPRCQIMYYKAEDHFHKSSTRYGGLHYMCKLCKKDHDRTYNISEKAKAKTKIRYKKEKEKIKARAKAHKFYKGLSFQCSVVGCKETHDELHHVNYKRPLDVVPLCKYHHYGIHNP